MVLPARDSIVFTKVGAHFDSVNWARILAHNDKFLLGINPLGGEL
jgi:hypothetical protein